MKANIGTEVPLRYYQYYLNEPCCLFFCFVKVKSSDCYGRIRIRMGGNGHLLGTSGNKPGQEGFPAFPQRTILHATLKVQLHPHFKNA